MTTNRARAAGWDDLMHSPVEQPEASSSPKPFFSLLLHIIDNYFGGAVTLEVQWKWNRVCSLPSRPSSALG